MVQGRSALTAGAAQDDAEAMEQMRADAHNDKLRSREEAAAAQAIRARANYIRDQAALDSAQAGRASEREREREREGALALTWGGIALWTLVQRQVLVRDERYGTRLNSNSRREFHGGGSPRRRWCDGKCLCAMKDIWCNCKCLCVMKDPSP